MIAPLGPLADLVVSFSNNNLSPWHSFPLYIHLSHNSKHLSGVFILLFLFILQSMPNDEVWSWPADEIHHVSQRGWDDATRKTIPHGKQQMVYSSYFRPDTWFHVSLITLRSESSVFVERLRINKSDMFTRHIGQGMNELKEKMLPIR